MSEPRIPEAMLRGLELVPRDVPAALLLRHSHRPDLPIDAPGDEVDLTPEGVRMAEEFGAALSSRWRPGRLLSSPVLRCRNTVIALARGAGWSVPALEDPRLGAPGAFVVDGDAAFQVFRELGTRGVVIRQLSRPDPARGMRSTAEGVRLLVEALTESAASPGDLDVLVTHDALIAVLVGTLLGSTFEYEERPAYLEGVFTWREGDRLAFVWRGRRGAMPWSWASR